MFGSIIGIMNCTFMHFQLPGVDIFGVAMLIGITQAILLIASLGTTAELINKNTVTIAENPGDCMVPCRKAALLSTVL